MYVCMCVRVCEILYTYETEYMDLSFHLSFLYYLGSFFVFFHLRVCLRLIFLDGGHGYMSTVDSNLPKQKKRCFMLTYTA